MTARLDHLVIAAATLEQGVAWCEATLGVTPGPGGEHPLMGTHNRLLRIATVDHPRAYLEIIAINPVAARPGGERAARWFDLDSEALQAQLAAHGPRLVHFVASVPDVRAATQAWHGLGIDRGEVVTASRMTPRGLLQWQITIRGDGQRLFDGVLPTLIEWGDTHPATAMADSGLRLQSLVATHTDMPTLQAAYAAIGLHGVALRQGPPNLCAQLHTPRGLLRLDSGGL